LAFPVLLLWDGFEPGGRIATGTTLRYRRRRVPPGTGDEEKAACRVTKAQDLEYARWQVVSAALSHVGEDIAYHRSRRTDWAGDLGRALDQYVVIATGEAPKHRAGLRVAGVPPGDRIIRASLLFALAAWRPTEFAEWGPLPDPEAARRELIEALKAWVEAATGPAAGES
jgi:hypothetical protein